MIDRLARLQPSPLGAGVGRSGDVELDRRVGHDDRADVAAVDDRPPRLGGEGALGGAQHLAHRRVNRDAARRRPGLERAERRIVQPAKVEATGMVRRDNRVIWVLAGPCHGQTDGAIEQTRVEHRQPVGVSQGVGDSPLARGGGAVDGDDETAHAGSSLAPRPPMSWLKPGKLVSIISAASTLTGCSAARPSTRCAMAIRWSPWVSMQAPPRTR